MSNRQVFWKRMFDIFFSLILLLFFWPIIFICWLVATIETRSNGFFLQSRVGRHGKFFKVIKIKTMFDVKLAKRTSISTSDMEGLTVTGAFFRKYKLDELPQLLNVLFGDMSFVGPRPDVPGYADMLVGEDRVILNMRPGITGPASIKYKNEEFLLSQKSDPQKFNDEVIWPDKVKINKYYFYNFSFKKDLLFLIKTL